MTSDELERAIDFLLKSGARCDARIDQLSEDVTRLSGIVERLSGTVDKLSGTVDKLSATVERLAGDTAQTSSRLESFAATQSQIMVVMTRTFEAQSQINASLRTADDTTDRRLNALIEALDRGRDAGR